MKWKYLAVILSGVFAVGSVFIGSVYAKKRNQEIVSSAVVASPKSDQTKRPVANSNSHPSDILKKVYLNDQNVFLLPGLTADQLSVARNEAEKIEDLTVREETEALINAAGAKLTILNDLNALYSTPVLNGDAVDNNAVLKEDKSQNDVEELKKRVEDESNDDAFYHKVLEILGSHPEVSGGTVQNTNQSADAANARRLIEVIVKDGKIHSDFTMEQYEQARNAVKSLPDGSEKEELMKDIRIIQSALKNMGVSYEE